MEKKRGGVRRLHNNGTVTHRALRRPTKKDDLLSSSVVVVVTTLLIVVDRRGRGHSGVLPAEKTPLSFLSVNSKLFFTRTTDNAAGAEEKRRTACGC